MKARQQNILIVGTLIELVTLVTGTWTGLWAWNVHHDPLIEAAIAITVAVIGFATVFLASVVWDEIE